MGTFKARLLPEHEEYIKIAFASMQSIDHFIDLLNNVSKLIYGDKSVHFDTARIKQLNDSNIKSTHYRHFSRKKKNGGVRIINAPSKELSSIQKTLSLIFQAIGDIHPNASGFRQKKSIVDNAKMHIGQPYVYNIDLKDFFPSITQYKIIRWLQSPPFSFDNQNNRFYIARFISDLCCHNLAVKRYVNDQLIDVTKSVLPQGAPTSPVLSNIICYDLDNELLELAKDFGLNYTRYVDDITFSSVQNVYHRNGNFLWKLKSIISKHGFQINDTKTRLQKKEYKQVVTGLIVNEKVNIPIRYVKKLRMWLYLWEHYGYDKATDYFMPHYLKEKNNPKDKLPQMASVIDGKLNYLKMVKGETSTSYQKLKERFDRLKLNKPIV